MNTKLILTCSIALYLCSCSRSDPSGKQTGADTQGTVPKSEVKAAAAGEQPGMFWELVDGSDLKVVTAPWPPGQGTVILKVEVTPNEKGEKFGGTVACRVAVREWSYAAWQPMEKVREDSRRSVYFTAPVILVRGPAYIQFRVRGAGEKALHKDFIDLTDWKVEIR